MKHTFFKSKYTLAVAVLIFILGVIALITLIPSLAWYGGRKDVDLMIDKGSVSYVNRYFESGNGKSTAQITKGYNSDGTWIAGSKLTGESYTSEEFKDPATQAAYEIKTPEQLYNLAWLQYLGYFNAPDSTGALTQTHFYLSKDLNMTGYTLPPIGTTQYPFIGTFDGNGHSISNLTVSDSRNDMTDNTLSEIPLQVKEELGNGDLTGTGIMGLFGVVGSYGSSDEAEDGTANIHNVTIKDLTVTSTKTSVEKAGAFGMVNSSASQTSLLKDIYVDNVNIHTTGGSENTVSGLAVGYVNAKIEGIGVIGGTLSTGSGKSEYSLVGGCAEQYLGTDAVTEVEVADPEITGWTGTSIEKGNDWGGSIDMKSMYNWLAKYRDKANNTEKNPNGTQYCVRETIIQKEDEYGNIIGEPINYSLWEKLPNPLAQYDTHSSTGAFSFTRSANVDYNEQYIFLLGKNKNDALYPTTKTTATIINTTEELNGFLISYIDENTNQHHYLNLKVDVEATDSEGKTKASLVDGTDESTATVWVQDEEGHVYTIGQDIDSGVYANGGIRYYLNPPTANNEKNAVVWNLTRLEGGGQSCACTYDGEVYFLTYQDGAWMIQRESYYVVTDGENHYLSVDRSNNELTNVNDSTESVSWKKTDDNRITTVMNGENRYLQNDGGDLLLDNSGTVWTLASSIQNGEYILKYFNENWQLLQDSSSGYLIYLRKGNINYYLTVNGSDVVSTTEQSDAVRWIVGNNTVRVAPSGKYLKLDDSSVTLSDQAPSNMQISGFESGSGSIVYSKRNLFTTTTRYLSLDDNFNWKSSGSTSQVQFRDVATAKTGYLEQITSIVQPVTIVQGKSLFNINRTTEITDNGYPIDSWYPIAVDGDVPDSRNTGYVVSGGNYDNNSSDHYQDGDIRVSYYGIEKIETSYKNSEIIELYTITGDGSTTRPSTIYTKDGGKINEGCNFVKFDSSRKQLEQILASDSQNVYGLHFMKAEVSANDFLTAKEVSINDQSYYDYQLPRHCIDFNLQEKGYINFFAGEYYSTGFFWNQKKNESFFSLHRVWRNENEIERISEITKIYGTRGKGDYVYEITENGQVVYVDKDGTIVQKGSLELIFDTAWIKTNSNIVGAKNRLFYFEIPVDAGEYALGSADTDGGYLLYLDISANAQLHDYTVTEEAFKTREATFHSPKGVDFVENTSQSVSDSASFSVETSSSTTYTFQLNGENLSINNAIENGNSPNIQYIKEGNTVSCNDEKQSLHSIFPRSKIESKIEKNVTLQSLNTATGEFSKLHPGDDAWPFTDDNGKDNWDVQKAVYRTNQDNPLVHDSDENASIFYWYSNKANPVNTETTLVFDPRSDEKNTRWYYKISLESGKNMSLYAKGNIKTNVHAIINDNSEIDFSTDEKVISVDSSDPFTPKDIIHTTSFPEDRIQASNANVRMIEAPMRMSYGRTTYNTTPEEEPVEPEDPILCGDVQFVILPTREDLLPDLPEQDGQQEASESDTIEPEEPPELTEASESSESEEYPDVTEPSESPEPEESLEPFAPTDPPEFAEDTDLALEESVMIQNIKQIIIEEQPMSSDDNIGTRADDFSDFEPDGFESIETPDFAGDDFFSDGDLYEIQKTEEEIVVLDPEKESTLQVLQPGETTIMSASNRENAVFYCYTPETSGNVYITSFDQMALYSRDEQGSLHFVQGYTGEAQLSLNLGQTYYLRFFTR